MTLLVLSEEENHILSTRGCRDVTRGRLLWGWSGGDWMNGLGTSRRARK